MFEAFRTVISDAGLRIATITMFCLGFAYASTLPYESIIGITQLGLSEQKFGALLLAAAIVTTLGVVVIGHFSDLATDRKTAILWSLVAGAFGFGLFFFVPNVTTFMLCLLVFIPIATAVPSQLFAVIRTISNEHGSVEAASVNSAVRTIFAGSWIVVPGLVGAFIAWTGRASDAYGIAALAYVLCLGVYFRWGPSGGQAEPTQQGRLAGLIDAFRLILSGRIMSRLLALALIGVTHPVNATLMPLIVTETLDGSTRDIGILAGMVAALEIPFMLLGGMLARRIPLWALVAIGGVIHAIYILSLGFMTSVPQIYGLAVLNAAGASMLFTIHISYLQDLIPDRPGLGTSLLSVELLITRSIGAMFVAGVGLLFGLTGALSLAAFAGSVGAGLIVMISRR